MNPNIKIYLPAIATGFGASCLLIISIVARNSIVKAEKALDIANATIIEHRKLCPLLKPPSPSFFDGTRFAQISIANQPGITDYETLFAVSSNWWFEIEIAKGTNLLKMMQIQARMAQQAALAAAKTNIATNVVEATNSIAKTNKVKAEVEE